MTLPRNNPTNTKKSMFLAVLVVAAVLVGGCVGGEPTPPPDQPTLSPEGTITYVTPEQAFALIQENSNNPDFVIIDVRQASHFAAGHIEGAVNIPYYTLREEVNELDKSKTYLTYCPDGCGAPARIMEEANFQKIYDISGGYNRWVGEGFPIVQ
jgi:rhodanese-related sulfurtransferase